MVGLVLVSHSHALAEAVLTLVRAMSGPEVPIAIAAGTGENKAELGTDAMEIYSAVESVFSDDGVLILMDMGSAILSAEMALDFLDETVRQKVKLCPSSFVEGAVAAGVSCKIGSSIEQVYTEASSSLRQKEEQIAPQDFASPQEETKNLENAESIKVIIPNPHGLHARPVAKLIQFASQYDSDIQIKNLTNGKGPVSIKSMTGIVSLEALKGNEIELYAKGDDAKKALTELKLGIEKGLGDSLEDKNPSDSVLETKNILESPIGISQGIVIGKAIYPKSESLNIPENTIDNTEQEINRLKSALEKTAQQLDEKSVDVSKRLGKEHGEIFKAQALILSDPTILENTSKLIQSNKYNAAKAWNDTIDSAISVYKNLIDKNLQQRALDLKDASHLVLEQLGISISDKIETKEEGIIILEDITPSQVTTLDTDKIKGVICLENGPTSHSSILLRSRGIPSIVLAKNNEETLLNLPSDSTLIMDGKTGQVIVNPNEETLNSFKKRQKIETEQKLKEKEESSKPAITLDGKTIDVFANVGREEDSITASENGAEGIGLLRTEFMFIEREKAPLEEEQISIMKSILAPMKGKPIIIRTLDAGGDKNIPYLNMPKEENPFLGVRAIRLCLRNKELFQQQLRAILQISTEFDVRIMFPMISILEELKEAKTELNKAHDYLVSKNIPHTWPIQTGMMMEVPSAAIMAMDFMPEVDFVSIGTNDLTQYTMAVDRGNPELQNISGKGLNPAVIELIRNICNSAKKHKVTVAVCGESASDPDQASKLIGLGVTELSMNGRSIPAIKQWIREQSFAELEKMV